MTACFGDAYRGRRVLVTGHTGFKGSWLSMWLHSLGADVSGYALGPPTSPSNFVVSRVAELLGHNVIADIRDSAALARAFEAVDPEFVFHLAAQPLVRESYSSPAETVEVNVMGTVNILETVRQHRKPCTVVVVTSDKCYENREWPFGYREVDTLGGYDPYSMSKGATELVVSSWRRSFFPPDRLPDHCVRLASARAGNVIGGGDWQRDRIMVDCIAALGAGRPIEVRNQNATRPWQHVLEPLAAYLLLGSRLQAAEAPAIGTFADAWNFGPSASSCWPVGRLVDEVVKCWGTGSWLDHPDPKAPHEAGFLTLCCDKAARVMGWRPLWGVNRAVAETVAWYKAFARGADVAAVCRQQIASFCADAARMDDPWLG